MTGLIGLLLLISPGCSRITPNGVTISENGVVSALYKPCRDDAIGRIELYDRRDLRGRPIWSARLENASKGTLRIAITDKVPGYSVTDKRGVELTRDQVYRLDAQSRGGIEWGGTTFRVSELTPGEIRLWSGRVTSLKEWLNERTECVPRGIRILSDALRVGIVLAMVIGAVLGLTSWRRRLRRRGNPIGRE
jgi:hypothetical protein